MHGDLEVAAGVVIPARELEWSFVASGGPGGQHANRSQTKAVLRFDIGASAAIPDSVRERLLEKLPDVVVIEVDDQRSQWQNRRLARNRLRERLSAALYRPAPRRPTKPSKGAKRRRLTAKRQRAELKRQRRPPSADA